MGWGTNTSDCSSRQSSGVATTLETTENALTTETNNVNIAVGGVMVTEIVQPMGRIVLGANRQVTLLYDVK